MSAPIPVRVRGAATAEELAAVLAALAARGDAGPDRAAGYERWRAGRRRALRASPTVQPG